MTLHLVANHKSGQGKGAEISEIAKRLCAELGHKLVEHQINDPSEIDQRAREAVKAAVKGDVILAAGGDGTLRSVAEAVAGTGHTYAVVATGTFNFFARSHQIPDDPEQAIRLALTGQPKPIRLGKFNDRIFIINASLGLYVKSIKDREESTKKFGRHRIVVLISTAITLLKPHRLLHITMRIGEKKTSLRSPLVFIGNNALQFRDLKLKVKDCFREDRLGLLVLKPVHGIEMARVLARGIAHTLETEERLDQFCVDDIEISTKRTHQTVALDGEMFEMSSPFRIQAWRDALSLVVPPVIHLDPSL
jgi:diacylglycerol kinase family enzyme